MIRALFLFGVLTTLPSLVLAAEDPVHVVQNRGWAQQPSVPSSMSRRIEEAASQYQQFAPIPRIALFDVAYPSSDSELKDMDGYAVILVSVLSQEARELPPKRVFVSSEGREYPLKLASGAVSALPQSTAVDRVLGKNRWDGLLLLPVHLVRDNASVVLDFAANRHGFVVQRFSNADRIRLSYAKGPVAPPKLDAPPTQAVMKLVSREFPGFVRRP